MLIQDISIIMKKGNLWVFGDSYGTFPPRVEFEKLKDRLWIPMLAEKLNHNNFYNICQKGSANEWIYYSLVNNVKLINPIEDTIIVITTQIHRQWFFYDNVGASNHYMNGIEEYVDKGQATAIKHYQKYLSDNPQDFIRAQWFLYSLEVIKARQNYNLIVLPGFRNNELDYGNSTGSLFDISVNEVKGKTIEAWNKWLANNSNLRSDPRTGHLSFENHKILAEKLHKCFLNHELLDLTQGFVEEIL